MADVGVDDSVVPLMDAKPEQQQGEQLQDNPQQHQEQRRLGHVTATATSIMRQFQLNWVIIDDHEPTKNFKYHIAAMTHDKRCMS